MPRPKPSAQKDAPPLARPHTTAGTLTSAHGLGTLWRGGVTPPSAAAGAGPVGTPRRLAASSPLSLGHLSASSTLRPLGEEPGKRAALLAPLPEKYAQVTASPIFEGKGVKPEEWAEMFKWTGHVWLRKEYPAPSAHFSRQEAEWLNRVLDLMLRDVHDAGGDDLAAADHAAIFEQEQPVYEAIRAELHRQIDVKSRAHGALLERIFDRYDNHLREATPLLTKVKDRARAEAVRVQSLLGSVHDMDEDARQALQLIKELRAEQHKLSAERDAFAVGNMTLSALMAEADEAIAASEARQAEARARAALLDSSNSALQQKNARLLEALRKAEMDASRAHESNSRLRGEREAAESEAISVGAQLRKAHSDNDEALDKLAEAQTEVRTLKERFEGAMRYAEASTADKEAAEARAHAAELTLEETERDLRAARGTLASQTDSLARAEAAKAEAMDRVMELSAKLQTPGPAGGAGAEVLKAAKRAAAEALAQAALARDEAADATTALAKSVEEVRARDQLVEALRGQLSASALAAQDLRAEVASMQEALDIARAEAEALRKAAAPPPMPPSIVPSAASSRRPSLPTVAPAPRLVLSMAPSELASPSHVAVTVTSADAPAATEPAPLRAMAAAASSRTIRSPSKTPSARSSRRSSVAEPPAAISPPPPGDVPPAAPPAPAPAVIATSDAASQTAVPAAPKPKPSRRSSTGATAVPAKKDESDALQSRVTWLEAQVAAAQAKAKSTQELLDAEKQRRRDRETRTALLQQQVDALRADRRRSLHDIGMAHAAVASLAQQAGRLRASTDGAADRPGSSGPGAGAEEPMADEATHREATGHTRRTRVRFTADSAGSGPMVPAEPGVPEGEAQDLVAANLRIDVARERKERLLVEAKLADAERRVGKEREAVAAAEERSARRIGDVRREFERHVEEYSARAATATEQRMEAAAQAAVANRAKEEAETRAAALALELEKTAAQAQERESALLSTVASLEEDLRAFGGKTHSSPVHKSLEAAGVFAQAKDERTKALAERTVRLALALEGAVDQNKRMRESLGQLAMGGQELERRTYELATMQLRARRSAIEPGAQRPRPQAAWRAGAQTGGEAPAAPTVAAEPRNALAEPPAAAAPAPAEEVDANVTAADSSVHQHAETATPAGAPPYPAPEQEGAEAPRIASAPSTELLASHPLPAADSAGAVDLGDGPLRPASRAWPDPAAPPTRPPRNAGTLFSLLREARQVGGEDVAVHVAAVHRHLESLRQGVHTLMEEARVTQPPGPDEILAGATKPSARVRRSRARVTPRPSSGPRRRLTVQEIPEADAAGQVLDQETVPGLKRQLREVQVAPECPFQAERAHSDAYSRAVRSPRCAGADGNRAHGSQREGKE